MGEVEEEVREVRVEGIIKDFEGYIRDFGLYY